MENLVKEALEPEEVPLANKAFVEKVVALGKATQTFDEFKSLCAMFGRFDGDKLEAVFAATAAPRTATDPTQTATTATTSTTTETATTSTQTATPLRQDLQQDREWYDDQNDNTLFLQDTLSIKHTPKTKLKSPIDETPIRLFARVKPPPFLENIADLAKPSPINIVKDNESRLAKIALNGSPLVHLRRSQRERKKQTQDALSAQGSILGQLTRSSGHTNTQKEIQQPRKQYTQQEIQKQRESLPAYVHRNEFLSVIRENQVVVVVGETGSGKTTQLTQILYEANFSKNATIGCTQPRRVAAMSVAKRVSEEMGVKLGKEVGYSIRFEDQTSSSTRIKYMTDGILLRECLSDPLLEKYSCVIIDEAHERALNTDLILGLFRSILRKRSEIRLIVTSATLDAQKFSSFFGCAPIIKIPGRTFPVHVNNLRTPVDDYVQASVKQVITIHLKMPPGDILVFMTGQEDIDTTCEEIQSSLDVLDDPQPLLVLPVYSQLPQDLQTRIFLPAPEGYRKVIVATNIAETSLTVDGIKYVVDAGFAKVKVYRPHMGIDALQLVPISRANAAQRAGRAGRTSEGFAYRMYTKQAENDEMFAEAIPEIRRTNLSNTMLLLKSLSIDNLDNFDFLERPSPDGIASSLQDLWILGAIDNSGSLTELGRRFTSFPIDPYMAQLLVASADYRCSQEMLTIVAMMTVPNVFYRPKERSAESDAAREKFFVAESDHLTLLNVYNQWLFYGSRDMWATQNFLHAKSLKRAQSVREQLSRILLSASSRALESCGNDYEILRRCICKGYFHQAARTKGLHTYIGLRNNVIMNLHPTSSLYGLGYLPDHVVYHELIMSSQQFMTGVTAVKAEWLLQDGHHLYYTQNDIQQSEPEAVTISEKPAVVSVKSSKPDRKRFRRFARGV